MKNASYALLKRVLRCGEMIVLLRVVSIFRIEVAIGLYIFSCNFNLYLSEYFVKKKDKKGKTDNYSKVH